MACVLGVSVPLLQATTAVPAHADDRCTAGVICSATTNLSAFRVLAVEKWNCKEPCKGRQEWLAPGKSTPLLEDWDGFRVDSGWCYSYVMSPPNLLVRTYGRKNGTWIRVHNGVRATIVGQARVPSFLCL
ncbi:hypothetical protein [Saccharothrix violaceirubra]|uniref:Peptidase inhibitor family I36 n=1 Tax=Saccharothrix violaceirubra TaxID=413306 RepID=A0A7W7WW01_9PSEU|nr:hypothetical protein [Saccharothrix violaceirubra]MBB4965447.1 hypothetical protein [Saccharothrix violaceirubra]